MGRIFVGKEPSRRSRVTLGSRGTVTDLCGFHVFFDVTQSEHELAFYDNEGNLLRKTNLVVSSGIVVEENLDPASSVPQGLWSVH